MKYINQIRYKHIEINNKNTIGLAIARPYPQPTGRGILNISPRDMTDPNIILDNIGIKPIKVWDNLDNKDVCLEISKEVKGKSGIYLIGNKITGNTYVGSGSINKLYKMFRKHLYNKNGNKLINKSIKEYGLNNFYYVILEYYPDIINKNNNINLILLEIYYIKLIGPKYNILTEAGNNFGFKHSEEILFNFKDNYSNSKINYFNIKNKEINIICIKTNQILCTFKNINQTAHYLCCSNKTIQHSLKLGTICLPNLFIPLLNQSHIDKYNSIIEYIDKSQLYLNDYELNNSIKLKGSLVLYKHFTKFKISNSFLPS